MKGKQALHDINYIYSEIEKGAVSCYSKREPNDSPGYSILDYIWS